MRSSRNNVIYVGKAKNLKRRISSYFNVNNTKTKALRNTVAEIEVILTESEIESLSLENNLIKLYKPRFNKALKNEKWTYYYLLLTGEKYPSIVKYRPLRLNKTLNRRKLYTENKVIGPYTSSSLRETMAAFVTDNFKIRTCKPLKRKVCVRYHIGNCTGICERKVTDEEYAEQIAEAVKFLYGMKKDIVKYLQKSMKENSKKRNFEKAQKVKNTLEVIKRTLNRQIVERPKGHSQIIAVSDKEALLTVLIKKGVVLFVNFYNFSKDDFTDKLRSDIEKFCEDHIDTYDQIEILTDKIYTGKHFSSLDNLQENSIRRVDKQDAEEKELLKLAQINFKYRKKFMQ